MVKTAYKGKHNSETMKKYFTKVTKILTLKSSKMSNTNDILESIPNLIAIWALEKEDRTIHK